MTSQLKHWVYIRSTNVIESTFATVRLRTEKTKGCGTRLATLTMVFKLAPVCQQAGVKQEKTWYRIKGYKLIPHVIKGVRFDNISVSKCLRLWSILSNLL